MTAQAKMYVYYIGTDYTAVKTWISIPEKLSQRTHYSMTWIIQEFPNNNPNTRTSQLGACVKLSEKSLIEWIYRPRSLFFWKRWCTHYDCVVFIFRHNAAQNSTAPFREFLSEFYGEIFNRTDVHFVASRMRSERIWERRCQIPQNHWKRSNVSDLYQHTTPARRTDSARAGE